MSPSGCVCVCACASVHVLVCMCMCPFPHHHKNFNLLAFITHIKYINHVYVYVSFLPAINLYSNYFEVLRVCVCVYIKWLSKKKKDS